MKGLMGAISTSTKVGVQFVKQRVGITQSKIDPLFEEANQKYIILRNRYKKFKTYTDEILESVPEVCRICNELSTTLYEADNSSLNLGLRTFFKASSDSIHMCLYGNSLIPLKEAMKLIENQLINLKKCIKERKKISLLCGYCSDELARISSNGKPEQISEKKICLDKNVKALKQITKKFISEVNELWEQRFLFLDLQLTIFSKNLVECSDLLQIHTSVLREHIPSEELDAEYDVYK